ncbi:MAG: tRNA pseudouridine(38-40) synthase TruA [Chlorobium sp.]|jgi:tRNA pseudouridine38-40 synthase|uniref:tRNA pseudouridine(38-40) synthase TruA n=1 Tax=Chlorobium sp. TaxID=1095 RepID=UPI0025C6F455|nr:tRNA pseudouridine(38-40) synthase TruA [Chlorobium sp.]MCF8216052.1 tRNA pseudouridine(38-40) synthase TruA [Chlorobium sp.]MCF8270953.1 tRNA pseudouridine(38-40) synthase TruA [Chlorobium sp.]MCF8287327.1 tRNA pseudouridine(38-40) synthase TruA [Chlorobium sp.]MCF8291413.1 tRNA pseudouridine(38-40) synthase TruA [Chlorobium sp.]MCF8384961.1 tRNA pseudouridine(38-40) synthase TruA [Chlorobium sp.]
MRNICLHVEYDGTDYCGWQRQQGSIPTVQGKLESILRLILQEQVELMAAGRTDKGVHARGQVVNFMTASKMDLHRMVYALNRLLPATIRVSGSKVETADFHARFSAKEREYRYFLIERPSALRQRFTGCSGVPLDLSAMQHAAGFVVGVHDFSVFSKEPSGHKGLFCNVTSCIWTGEDDQFVLSITANRFLRSMVRYLVSAMIAIGRGERRAEDFGMVLETGKPSFPLVPAAPGGLFLWEVRY